MLVYLAHPIDQNKHQHPQAARIEDVEHLLATCRINRYRPGTAFYISPRMAPGAADLRVIDRINRVALAECDALVAWLPGGVPTLGVPSEIEAALNDNKPTLILTDIVGSVQIENWAGRGASVILWSDAQSRAWEADPTGLHVLLTREPQDGPRAQVDVTGLNDPRPKMVAGRKVNAAAKDLLVRLGQAATEPSRAYQDDAGLDLAIDTDWLLEDGEYQMLPTGVLAAVPSGWWGMITGRSSTWAKYRCDVRLAVIDAGYRGELMIGIENRSGTTVKFKAGTRLAQYVLIPTFPGRVVQVDQLPVAHRGEQGYGSSGR